jgi:hypothetical protein
MPDYIFKKLPKFGKMIFRTAEVHYRRTEQCLKIKKTNKNVPNSATFDVMWSTKVVV